MSHIYVGNVPQSLPFSIKKNGSTKVDTFAYFSTINQLSFCNYEQFMFIVNTFFAKMINKKECYLKHKISEVSKPQEPAPKEPEPKESEPKEPEPTQE